MRRLGPWTAQLSGRGAERRFLTVWHVEPRGVQNLHLVAVYDTLLVTFVPAAVAEHIEVLPRPETQETKGRGKVASMTPRADEVV